MMKHVNAGNLIVAVVMWSSEETFVDSVHKYLIWVAMAVLVASLTAIFNRMAETLTVNASLRKQFLANIAHELRTPLAIIQGPLEGMVGGVIETSKEQLSSLHEETIRLNRLITDLRDLSLAQVRQLALEKRLLM